MIPKATVPPSTSGEVEIVVILLLLITFASSCKDKMCKLTWSPDEILFIGLLIISSCYPENTISLVEEYKFIPHIKLDKTTEVLTIFFIVSSFPFYVVIIPNINY